LIATAGAKVFETYNLRFSTNTAAVYAKLYSTDELKQMTEFFRAPAGQKFITSFTQVLQQTSAANREAVEAAIRENAKTILADAKAKGLKVSPDIEPNMDLFARSFAGQGCPDNQCVAHVPPGASQ
nr:DUF2059 domain-containing protein [Pseudomonadota bacterium]